jgi:hypothetical protein
VSDDAWISLCTYNRLKEKFGTPYPEKLADWLLQGRIERAKAINPHEEPCRSTLCNRAELNMETAKSLAHLKD